MKKAHAMGGVLGVVVLGGAVAMLRTPRAPDVETLAPEELVKVIASSQFDRLPEDQRQAYARKVFEGRRENRGEGASPMDALSDREREAFRENVRPLMRQQMRERMDSYFELPPNERVKLLDEMIDERERHRAEGGEQGGRGWGPPGGGPPPGDRPPPAGEGESGEGPSEEADRPRGPTPDRMKEHIESSSPEDRAKMLEFMKDMRERRSERGLD